LQGSRTVEDERREMAQITASAVKSLRDKTQLPMMECKKALSENDGDEQAAIDWLRKKGKKTMAKRADRETAFGRMGIYTSVEGGVGAMVELKCESASVTQNAEFITLANALAQQLATGPGAATADELLDQSSPCHDGKTLREEKDDLFNKIREVFNVGRMVRVDAPCGGYSHNATTVAGVIVEVEGGNDEVAKDIAMHVAACGPQAVNVEQLDADTVAKEREIITDAARAEGKPENIIEKMVDGRMRSYFAQHVLNEQPFIKEEKLTVSKYAKQAGMKVIGFTRYVLGSE